MHWEPSQYIMKVYDTVFPLKPSFLLINRILLRPRKRLRSIVMRWSLCVCVCLSASISPVPHALSLPIFFINVANHRGLVLIRRGEEIPKRIGQFWGFVPH